MKENNINKRSVAIKDCITRIIMKKEYQDSLSDIDLKLNKILYRQNLNKKILEQFFSNFGFEINLEVEKDKMLKDFYQKNNKYIGRFD